MARSTTLHDWHVSHGANMAEFGGYDMPVWYSAGARAEHLAVLTGVGVFDTSHMAGLLVSGPDAFKLLQRAHTKDLRTALGERKGPSEANRCTYGVFLDEQGGVIDDAIVGEIAPGEYFVVVNAGMGPKVARHLEKQLDGGEVAIADLTDRLGKIDVQGPAAAKVLSKTLENPEEVFAGMGYFTFKGHFDPASAGSKCVRLTDGTPVLLSRTGYTGEFGFEIYVEAAHAQKTWESIMAAGEPFGIKPCGLAARDSLRAGAVLPLSHQDIGSWPFINTPWPFALPLEADGSSFTKDFVGRQALESVAQPEYTCAFVGFDLRKVAMHPSPATVLDADGAEIGVATTCVSDMGIGRSGDRIYSVSSSDKPESFKARGLSCGFVKLNKQLPEGTEIRLRDGKREIRAEIVKNVRPARTARHRIEAMLA